MPWMVGGLSSYFIFLVLSSVGKARDDGRNPFSRSDLASVDHDEKLHEIVIDLAATGLNDVHILTTDRLANFNAKGEIDKAMV